MAPKKREVKFRGLTDKTRQVVKTLKKFTPNEVLQKLSEAYPVWSNRKLSIGLSAENVKDSLYYLVSLGELEKDSNGLYTNPRNLSVPKPVQQEISFPSNGSIGTWNVRGEVIEITVFEGKPYVKFAVKAMKRVS